MIYLEILLYLLVGALALYPLNTWPSAYMRDIKNGTAPAFVYQTPVKVTAVVIALIFACELVVWPISVPYLVWSRYRKRPSAGE